MTSMTFFLIFIPLLSFILLIINLIFAPHNPYQEKDSPFECGFHSFLSQNRTQFNISFFIFALLFLLFDLEILLVYPYVVSAYSNGIYGLMFMLIFFLALTLGFAFELGKGALKLTSRQNNIYIKYINSICYIFSNFKDEKKVNDFYENNTAIKLKSQISELVYLFVVNYIFIENINTDISYISPSACYNETIIASIMLLVCVAIITILLMDDHTNVPIKKEEKEKKLKLSIPYILDKPNGESQKQQVIRKITLQKAETGIPRSTKNIYSYEYLVPTVLTPSNITWLHNTLVATHPGRYEMKDGYRDSPSGRRGIIITLIGSPQAIRPGINLLADITTCPE